MIELRCTLLADGTSDRLLSHVITWAVHRGGARIEQESWADLSFVRPRPKGLAERAKHAGGRRRDKRKRQLPRMRARVAELIDDFGPLRDVPAFDHFIGELKDVLLELHATESQP